MPDGESLTRRRFLASISLLAPLASILACGRGGSTPASAVAPTGNGIRHASHTTWAVVDGRVTVSSSSPGAEPVPLCWFNDVGGRIWAAIDGRRDPEALASRISQELGVAAEPADVEDVALFVVELAKLGLVEGATRFELSRCEVGHRVV